MADDVDVIWEGSPLHAHLRSMGLNEESVEGRNGHHMPVMEENVAAKVPMHSIDSLDSGLPQEDSILLCSARSFMWPNEDKLALEVHVAKAILESELLVQEDEEFIQNFLLNEETMAEYQRLMQETPSRTSSLLSDIVLFSGSIAAVTGAVLYLSEKAKAATFAAALLPTAVAAMTSVRIGTKVQQDHETEHFHKVIELLLSDMKQFKQLVRKSLNLLQGMEMVSSGNYLSVDPSTGASIVASGGPPLSKEESKLARALSGRTTFPALRQAARKSTVQIIEAYREAVAKLMEISPLADHVDLREHYIAFVDLDNFNIEPSSSGADIPQITVQELKETAQVALVQQSEYLRRFTLTFCERVRDDNEINKAGVLKHIRDLLSTIRKINNKLARVLEYHQAMGLDMEKMASTKDLAIKTASAGPRLSSLKFVPLRSIYTSMFSTGLHLQHSLLKLRQLEKLFDAIERPQRKSLSADRSASPPLPIDEAQLLEWLGNFKDIQAELNACVGCLDEGVMQIDALQNRDIDRHHESQKSDQPPSLDDFEAGRVVVDANHVIEHFDEVFEAIISSSDASFWLAQEEAVETDQKELQRQSGMIIRELKEVLVHKAREHEIREAKALARQKGCTDPFGFPVRAKGDKRACVPNFFDDSFTEAGNNADIDDDDDESSSSSSECPTVKSVSPKEFPPLDVDDDPNWESSVTEPCSMVDVDDSEADYSFSSAAQNSYTYHTMSLSSLHEPDMEMDEACSHSFPNGNSLSNMRSISTPDLKSLTANAVSGSTYKNLANGMNQPHHDDTGSSSSSEWGSADELKTKTVLKTYRRPLRPTATKPKKNMSTNGDLGQHKKMHDKRQRNRSNVSTVNGVELLKKIAQNESSYASKHDRLDNPLSKPNQLLSGFQSVMASEAANFAKTFRNAGKEDIIGDDDSSSDAE